MTRARDQIERIYRDAVEAVDPRTCVRQAIEDLSQSAEIFQPSQKIHVIALGKAAAAMTAGADDALGDRIESGIVVTKEPPASRLSQMKYLEGSHPVPDERSLEAGDAVLDFAESVPEDTLVLCLISGGGSALVESLRPGIELGDLQNATNSLLRAGAPIEDLNAVRSRMSRIKGGGLLRALDGRPVVNLIVSDVLGDNLQAIASGPTVMPESTASAEELVQQYELGMTLPAEDSPPNRQPLETRVVANLPKAVAAAAGSAERSGKRPVLLTDRLEGEAREAGRILASILQSSSHRLSPLRIGDCVLAGGETTVTVRGDGIGGRNTEAALAAALGLRGTTGITVGFLATDGDDGVTGAAGAIVDGATISAEAVERARRALENNDSFGFLSETGAVWAPGATGTNVNDLVIAILE